jgi:hypothetical protein
MPTPVKHRRFWESQSVIVVGAFYDRNTGFISNNGCHFIGTGIGASRFGVQQAGTQMDPA